MLNVLRLVAAAVLLSLAGSPQQPAENKSSLPSTNPCASAANEADRTACWQDLARKAKAYLTGDPCPKATTDMERTNCWLDLATKANARLAAFYQKVQKAIKAHQDQQPPEFRGSDELGLEKLKSTQLAWTRYRDSQCDAVEQRYEGGTIAPSIRAGCQRDLAEQRIEELHQTYASYLVYP